MKRILAIGAHYDDIEMGCSGTILKHIMYGDEIYFAVLNTDEFRTGHPVDRIEEQNKAGKLFGLSGRFMFLFSETDSESTIIGELDGVDVDIVYAPFEHDTHQHHRRASVIAQAVSRKRHITTYFYDSGSAYDFHPNVFSVIDYDKKLEILNCFETQIECGAINLDIVQKKDAYWASLVSDKPNRYAEGFVVRKMRWKR